LSPPRLPGISSASHQQLSLLFFPPHPPESHDFA
jgi:hypothetical protein